MSEHKPVSPEVLAEIKAQLIKDKEDILRELGVVSVGESNKDIHAKFPVVGDKPDEQAQEIEGYTTNLATERILDDNLRDIDAALKRIEEGTYGTCKYCGQPIAEKRLQARPVASACVECKSKLQAQ
jgi:RNA polymerase-binding protein DksA